MKQEMMIATASDGHNEEGMTISPLWMVGVGSGQSLPVAGCSLQVGVE